MKYLKVTLEPWVYPNFSKLRVEIEEDETIYQIDEVLPDSGFESLFSQLMRRAEHHIVDSVKKSTAGRADAQTNTSDNLIRAEC